MIFLIVFTSFQFKIAVEILQKEGVVQIEGIGVVEKSYQEENHMFNLGGDDIAINGGQKGLIYCKLTVINGELQPFEYVLRNQREADITAKVV